MQTEKIKTKKSCIILAAGDGKRMLSEKPKVLMEVAFAPMLKWVLDSVIEAGITEIAVIIGNNAEMIDAFLQKDGKYKHCKTFMQSERKGTGHAVLQAELFLRENSDGDVLVLCGDAPFMDCATINDAYDLHKSQNRDTTVITAEIDNPAGYGRIIRSQDGNSMVGIVEDKDCTPEQYAVREINSGGHWFKTTALIDALPKLTNDNVKKEYYLTQTVEIMKDNAAAYKTSNTDIIIGANDRRTLREVNKIAFEMIIDKHSDNGVEIIGDCYICKDAVIGRGTLLLPGTVIRERCVVGENCSIGPYVHLRPDSVIKDGVKIGDFVEVKNSVIGEKTSIAHLTYIGDSDVGGGVNFGCGCVTANYDGVNKFRTVIGDNAFIGCNTNLIAPVSIGDNAMTAAGSTITKDVPANSLAIERGDAVIKENFGLNLKRKKK
jgi:bifunctional UDP-N-acetylglucosamine pyrophosphorylase/glucosamine-1-phosphate N-acetyltransferase